MGLNMPIDTLNINDLGSTIVPEWFTPLIIGICGSLIASLIIILFAKWRWKSVFFMFSGSSIFGHKIDYCFPNQKTAEPYIIESLKRSKKIKIYSMRAFSITEVGRPFNFVLDQRSQDVQILIADPGDNKNDNESIEERVRHFPKKIDDMTYRRNIYTSVEYVRNSMLGNNNIKCKLHCQPAFSRFIICDDIAYVSFFQDNLSGSEFPVLRVRHSSPLFSNINRIFSVIWKFYSRDISELNYIS